MVNIETRSHFQPQTVFFVYTKLLRYQVPVVQSLSRNHCHKLKTGRSVKSWEHIFVFFLQILCQLFMQYGKFTGMLELNIAHMWRLNCWLCIVEPSGTKSTWQCQKKRTKHTKSVHGVTILCMCTEIHISFCCAILLLVGWRWFCQQSPRAYLIISPPNHSYTVVCMSVYVVLSWNGCI